MSNIVDLSSLPRQRRSLSSSIPEGGAMILLFTGVQYVRDEADIEMYQALAASHKRTAAQPCKLRPKRASAGRKAAARH